jgi:peptide/nickel transport system permease protein
MFALRKLGLFLLTLWAAVTLNFILPRLMPGSPTDAALAKLSPPATSGTNTCRTSTRSSPSTSG